MQKWEILCTNPRKNCSKTYTLPNAKLAVNNGSAIAVGSKASFYLGFKPFTVSSGTLKVSVNGYEKEISINKETAFSAGKIKKINFNYDKSGADATYIFNTAAGLSALGITAPSKSSGTNLSGNDYTVNGINLAFAKGTASTDIREWNNNGSYELRSYSGNSMTFNAPSGYNITNIAITGATINTWSANPGTYNSGSWSGSAAAVVLTGTGSGKLNTITVKCEKAAVTPTIIDATVSDVVAPGVSSTKDITLTNYDEAPSLTANPDGTIITAAYVTSTSTNSATISYTVSPNYTGAARKGTITVSDGTVYGTITVNQVADVFSVTRTELELGAASGSTTTFTVKSDYDWTVVDDLIDGFTVNPASFTYNGTQSQTVTITATESNTKESDVVLGAFTFKRSGDNKETSTITVSQKSAKLATPSLTISKDATNKKFTVSWDEVANASKYEYYVMDGNGDDKVATTQTDDATTLSFEVTDINLGETYTVTVKAIGDNNPWVSSAEAEEEVKVEAGNKETTITFNGGKGSQETITWTSDAITCVAAKAESQNNPNEHAKDVELRLMAKNTLTFSGATIKKITFNFKTAKTLSASTGTYNTEILAMR